MIYFSANRPNNFTASLGSVWMVSASVSAAVATSDRSDVVVDVPQCETKIGGANPETLAIDAQHAAAPTRMAVLRVYFIMVG